MQSLPNDAPLARFGGILSSLTYEKSENGILNITTSLADDLIDNKDPVLRAEFTRLLSGKA